MTRSLRLITFSLLSCAASACASDVLEGYPEPHPTKSSATPAFKQVDGVVSMEAEHGKGGWQVVDEGHNGKAILATEGQAMTYTIEFSEPGMYYVWLHCRHNGSHSTNDATITFGGAQLYGSDKQTRPVGMRCHNRQISWWSLPKGPGAHTPVAIRDNPVHLVVPEAGVYDFVVTYRSREYVLDKIVIQPSAEAPEGSGPAETKIAAAH